MLISADWVLPIDGPPLRDGAVLISGDRIANVGSRANLEAAHPGVTHEHFAGCVMTPGLVNAHTHLTLSALADVIPQQPFTQWLPQLVAALKPWEIADHEASGIVGAEECLACGVTAVGDIAYGAAEVASAGAAGLGGVFYWEVLGIPPTLIAEKLAQLRFPTQPDAYGQRIVCGLSPHSVYTSGPELLSGLHDLATSLDVPSAIHLAESTAELQLLRDGSGPLAATAQRTAFGFTAPGLTPAEYLASLGALDGTTVVHLCHVTAPEIQLLAQQARGAVTCPRSNRYLSNPPPAIAPLLAAGIAVGVGTDSSASNHDLDLLAEVRALRQAEPALSCRELLRMATWGGAQAIGIADRYGVLAPGMFADMAIFRVTCAEEPEAAVVERGGRDSIEAVMSAGVWRVRDGKLLNHDPQSAVRAAGARNRSLAVLETIRKDTL